MSDHLQRIIYQSGDCEVDLARRELRTRGIPVPVGSRAFDIIETLVRSAGDLVTKDDLMERVWSGAIVEENTIQVHISALRKALGSHRGILKTESGPRYPPLGGWQPQRAAPRAVDLAAVMPKQDQAFSNNFPAAVSDLIGRTDAVQNLRDLLSAYREVTLVGPG